MYIEGTLIYYQDSYTFPYSKVNFTLDEGTITINEPSGVELFYSDNKETVSRIINRIFEIQCKHDSCFQVNLDYFEIIQ